jgi:signal peptidase I
VRKIAGIAVVAVTLICSVFLTGCFLGNPNQFLSEVISGSMMPTIPIGTVITLERTNNVSHNDIVWYKWYNANGAMQDKDGRYDNAIKRVIAFGGDTVKFKERDETNFFDVYLNGEPLVQNYQTLGYTPRQYISYQGFTRPCDATYKLVVPAGYFFIIGDNRGFDHGGSLDSRQLGPLNMSIILGKVISTH